MTRGSCFHTRLHEEFGLRPAEGNRNLSAEQEQALRGLLSFDKCTGLIWAVVLTALFTLESIAADGEQQDWLFQDVSYWGECIFKTVIIWG